jgi:hypothetical protein
MTTQKELTPDDAFLISEEAAARMAKTDNIECKVTVRYDAKGIPPASIYPDDYNNNPVK